jgi:hypothetical protein
VAAENALAKIAAVLPVPLTAILENPLLISAPVEVVVDKIDPTLLRDASPGSWPQALPTSLGSSEGDIFPSRLPLHTARSPPGTWRSVAHD